MQKYEFLLFDLDDTLIDMTENVRYAFKKMLDYINREYTNEEFNKWLNFDRQFWDDYRNNAIDVPIQYRTSQEIFVQYIRSLRYQLFFENITIEKAFEINELFLESLKHVAVALDGAYESLEYLSKKYRLVIATNGPSIAAKEKLKKINCLSFFEVIFSADMTSTTITKPDIKYFNELFDYIDYHDTDRLLIIGNSLSQDIKGAMEAKIDSCWFNPNN